MQVLTAQLAGQGLPPGAFPSRPVKAIGNRQAPCSQIDSHQPGARMTLPERTDILAKTTTHIQDELRLQADQIEAIEHARGHFAQQKACGVGPRGPTVELPAHGASITIATLGRMA